MTTYPGTRCSPIEKLPINFDQRTYIKEEIIVSDISDYSDTEYKPKNNNVLKIKKIKRRFMKKRNYKNVKTCSNLANKIIEGKNDNLISNKIKKKIRKLKKEPVKTDVDSNSEVYKLDTKEFLSNKKGYPNDIKLPIVVLERLSIKLEENLIIKEEEGTLSCTTDLPEDEKIDISTDNKLTINKCVPEETKSEESDKVENSISNIKIKDEIVEQINDDINYEYYEESEINDYNGTDKEFLGNEIKKENDETDLLSNDNKMPELILIKKCPVSDNEEDNILHENINIEDYLSRETIVEDEKINLSYINDNCSPLLTVKNSDINETTDTNNTTDEFINEASNNENKSFNLKEDYDQMENDRNYGYFEFQENERRNYNLTNFAQLLNIPTNFDEELVSEVIHDSEIENKIPLGLNQNLFKTVNKQRSYSSKGSKMKMFMEKCVSCNRVQKRIDDKISSRCIICEANVYYVCLICRSHYKYPAGIYNHISLKHTQHDREKPVNCQRCGLEFKANRNMKEHLRYCKVLPYLKCEFCSLMAKRKNCLRKHLRLKHKNDIDALDIEILLKKIVENSKDLKDQAIKMAESIYGGCSSTRMEPFPIAKHIKLYCNRCKGTFKKLLGIDQRSCRICGAQLFMQCVKCENVYKFRSSMSLHLKSKCVLSDKLALRCDKCEYVTFTKPRLKRHIYRRHTYIHPEDYLTCNKCEKKFKLKEDLQNHKSKCERSEWCSCNICDYKTNCREKFGMHLKYYHSMGKTFDGMTPSDINVKIVADSIIAYCSNCNLHTKAIEKLNKCQICKTPIVYRCKRCNMQKQKYMLLRMHVIRTHCEKIYWCPNSCGNSYAYLYDYRQHSRSCGKKQHFQCDRCSFKTKYKNIFVQHKQRNCVRGYTHVHKRNILSHCYKCGKIFKHKAYMLRHAKSCGKSTSLLFCDHCSFRTFTKHVLINHIQSKHAARLFRGINAFHCHNCTKVFRNYFVYSKHIEDCRSREKKA